jgi:hypothetical protein
VNDYGAARIRGGNALPAVSQLPDQRWGVPFVLGQVLEGEGAAVPRPLNLVSVDPGVASDLKIVQASRGGVRDFDPSKNISTKRINDAVSQNMMDLAIITSESSAFSFGWWNSADA